MIKCHRQKQKKKKEHMNSFLHSHTDKPSHTDTLCLFRDKQEHTNVSSGSVFS